MARDPSGDSINALEQHIRNLLTPSTPHLFNTLYDPFAEGADFVRGYPFSWRQGAPTAVSHGALLRMHAHPLPCFKPYACVLCAAGCHLGASRCSATACAMHVCRLLDRMGTLPSATFRLHAGLWLNIPDYDAPTQMVKPHERNTRYVDAVMTIPKVHGPACLCLYDALPNNA